MKKTTSWILFVAIAIFVIWVISKMSEASTQVMRRFKESGGAWVKDMYLGPFEAPSELPNPDDLSDKTRELYDRIAAEDIPGFNKYRTLYDNATGAEKLMFIDSLNDRQAAAKSQAMKTRAVWVWNRWKTADWYDERTFRESVGLTNPVIWGIWKIYAGALTAFDPTLYK